MPDVLDGRRTFPFGADRGSKSDEYLRIEQFIVARGPNPKPRLNLSSIVSAGLYLSNHHPEFTAIKVNLWGQPERIRAKRVSTPTTYANYELETAKDGLAPGLIAAARPCGR